MVKVLFFNIRIVEKETRIGEIFVLKSYECNLNLENMKSNLLISPIAIGICAFILFGFRNSNTHHAYEPFLSGGVANSGLGDRTGGPLSVEGTNCALCHFGAFLNSTATIVVRNSSGAPVTEYIAGNTYTIGFEVSGGSQNLFGFQGVVLDALDMQAGNLMNPDTSTQLVSIGDPAVTYAEHLGRSGDGVANFVFETEWVAPATNTGSVTIYMAGLAVDDDGSSSGDDATDAVSLTLTEAVLNTEELRKDVVDMFYDNTTKALKINALNNVELSSLVVVDIKGAVVFNLEKLPNQLTSIALDLKHNGIYIAKLTAKDGKQRVLKFTAN